MIEIKIICIGLLLILASVVMGKALYDSKETIKQLYDYMMSVPDKPKLTKD